MIERYTIKLGPAISQKDLDKALHGPEAEAQLPDMRKLRVRTEIGGELEDVKKISEFVKSLSSRNGQAGLCPAPCLAIRLYVQWDVAFEWDPAKTNFRNHGVRFEEAAPVFDDPYAISIADHEADPSEERFAGIGVSALGRVLVVVYAHRGDNFRITPARLAAAHERAEYEAGLP